jgi:8-oxo-dGTP pyrophosphatase MutT (NUDIX family)
MSNLYRDFSIALARFKNGVATEAETVMACQLLDSFQLDWIKSLGSINPQVASLPLWNFDADPVELSIKETGSLQYGQALELGRHSPLEEAEDDTLTPMDDETCRVWVVVRLLSKKTIMLCVLSVDTGNPGQFGLAGGHKHVGESCPHGAVRELKEETGISVVVETLRPMGHFTHKEVTHHFYTVSFNDVAELRASGWLERGTLEVDQFRWISEKNLKAATRNETDLDKKNRKYHKSIRRYMDLLAASARG